MSTKEENFQVTKKVVNANIKNFHHKEFEELTESQFLFISPCVDNVMQINDH